MSQWIAVSSRILYDYKKGIQVGNGTAYFGCPALALALGLLSSLPAQRTMIARDRFLAYGSHLHFPQLKLPLLEDLKIEEVKMNREEQLNTKPIYNFQMGGRQPLGPGPKCDFALSMSWEGGALSLTRIAIFEKGRS
jgi:hypothetical protein